MMEAPSLQKRKLPKLMACLTKGSLENLRNKALFNLDLLDAKGIRRRKLPLFECLLLELRETGFLESAQYLQDLLYDNRQLLAEDDIGIVVDLKKRNDYLEHICNGLQRAEKEKDKGNTKKESLELLNLALYYTDKGKGILWLAEKFFLASIAVASQYMIDGGRQKGCCKYHYAKFLLDKFPGADTDEPFDILTEVRDESIGKVRIYRYTTCAGVEFYGRPIDDGEVYWNIKNIENKVEVDERGLCLPRRGWDMKSWLLEEPSEDGDGPAAKDTLFRVTAIQLHRVLLDKARCIRKTDAAKAERLSRLAERRAVDADDTNRMAEAIIEIGISQLQMNSLKNALNSFQRAFDIQSKNNNVEGICEARMHLAAALQRLGDHEGASKMLTEMGALAMKHNLRRHLGRALHLLGELHLRRERPELGTQYLSEAFACFMGFTWDQAEHVISNIDGDEEVENLKLEHLYQRERIVFEQEAEQSRLMNAISAGQENMASYFNLLRESGVCTVSQVKTIEWKLSHAAWWIKRVQHDLVPCLCPTHDRTPLDVLRLQQELKKNAATESQSDSSLLERTDMVTDIRKLRSSYHHRNKDTDYDTNK